MVETLVQRVRTIERIPSYISVDKDKEMREEFEGRKDKNPLVHAVMEDKTTFLKAYERVLDTYKSGTLSKVELAALEDCFGELRLDYLAKDDYFDNPLVSGSTMAGVGSLLLLITVPILKKIKRNPQIDRRDFLLGTLAMGVLPPVVLGGMGAFIGSIKSESKQKYSEVIKQEVSSLDNVYARLYKK